MNIPLDIRPEEDLLLCCSRLSIDCERAERIKILLRNGIDWLSLSQLALRHGLMPLLYRNLKATHPDVVPKDIIDQFRKYYFVNACRNLFLCEELLKLLHLFEAHEISAISYKGPVFAASIYGDISLRQFADLDILIRNKDVSRARELLLSQGYHPTLNFNNAAEERVYFGSPYKRRLHFVRNDGKVPVDLHWGIESRYLSFASDLDLHEHVELTHLNGHAIKTVNTEYLVYLLCIHGAQHAWMQINWICDIAELIKLRRDIAWTRIMDRASDLGIRRMVSCGLLLASQLLGAELEEEMLRRMRVDPFVQSITDQVIRKLLRETGEGRGCFDREMFYLKIMERLGNKARYCFFLAMNPTHVEWSTLPLSKSLYFFYYLIRPLRLVGKYALRPLWKKRRKRQQATFQYRGVN